jgi:signal transduction histidine kinase
MTEDSLNQLLELIKISSNKIKLHDLDTTIETTNESEDIAIKANDKYYFLPFEARSAYNSLDKKLDFVTKLSEIKLFNSLDSLGLSFVSVEDINAQSEILMYKDGSEYKLIHPQRQVAGFGEITKLKNELENLDAFNSTLIHDIRSPFSVINLCSDYLLSIDPSSELPTEGVEFIERIRTHAKKGLKLSETLLDVFKSAQEKQLNKTKVNVLEFLNRVAEENQPLASDKNIEIVVQSEANDIFFDEDRISQAIENLIGNAIKFSTSDKKIFLETQVHQNMLSISVRDQGPGIPEDLLDSVFQKYKQLDHRSGKKLGAGLGLSIAQQFIKMHGGQITVQSKLDEGTTFTASLPLVDQDSITWSPSILVVDDDEDIREFIGMTLESHGIEFFEASDGLEALELFQIHHPKVIISDIKMPKMDGFELLGMIRNIAPDTSFIFASGYYPKISTEKSKQAFNTAKFLQKPFQERELVEIINICGLKEKGDT